MKQRKLNDMVNHVVDNGDDDELNELERLAGIE